MKLEITIRGFYEKHSTTKKSLATWYTILKAEKTLSLKDEIKQDFGESFGEDKYPLTIKKSSWLVNRNLNLIINITGKEIGYNEI